MNGREYIQESVRIFEERLLGRLDAYPDTSYWFINDATSLAEKTGYSPYHFSRLFSCVVGMPPKAYISSRILSEAAKRIPVFESKGRTLAAVAAAAGFENYETFSRSFRQFFSCAPASIRKAKSVAAIEDKLISPFTVECPVPDTFIAGNQVHTVQRSSFTITGMVFSVNEKQQSFSSMWSSFERKQRLVSNRVMPEQFCQYTAKSDTGIASDMLLMCALVTHADVVQNPFFVTRTIPGGTFLHVKHTTGIENIAETYRAIYLSFFANAEKPLASSWEYQLYNADGSTDIYIPLF